MGECVPSDLLEIHRFLGDLAIPLKSLSVMVLLDIGLLVLDQRSKWVILMVSRPFKRDTLGTCFGQTSLGAKLQISKCLKSTSTTFWRQYLATAQQSTCKTYSSGWQWTQPPISFLENPIGSLAVGGEHERNIRFAKAFTNCQAEGLNAMRRVWPTSWCFPQSFYQDVGFINDFVDYFVLKAIQHQAAVSEKGSADEAKRYVFAYELAKSTNDALSIRSELLNILLAGRDTIASLLSHVFFILARQPDVWSKCGQRSAPWVIKSHHINRSRILSTSTWYSMKRWECILLCQSVLEKLSG